MSLEPKKKKKKQVCLLELFTSEKQENFLLCSQGQYKLSEKVTITGEKVQISYASKCTWANNKCKIYDSNKKQF